MFTGVSRHLVPSTSTLPHTWLGGTRARTLTHTHAHTPHTTHTCHTHFAVCTHTTPSSLGGAPSGLNTLLGPSGGHRGVTVVSSTWPPLGPYVLGRASSRHVCGSRPLSLPVPTPPPPFQTSGSPRAPNLGAPQRHSSWASLPLCRGLCPVRAADLSGPPVIMSNVTRQGLHVPARRQDPGNCQRTSPVPPPSSEGWTRVWREGRLDPKRTK